MSIWSWDMFFQYLFNRYLFMGVLTTIWLTIAAMFFGIIFGLLAALCLLSKNRVVRFVGQVYTWVWRGSPLLVQILIIYTVLPLYRIKMDVVTSAIVALSMNEGAYLAEIIRGGITSIRKGQFEAAKALGMTYPTMMRLIILPQAMRSIVPDLGNRIIGMIKGTSMVSVIGMAELLRRSTLLIQENFAILEIYVIATMYYLILTTAWGTVQKRIEAYFGRGFVDTTEHEIRKLSTAEVEG
jgi:polar amino acid transport system permease protein